MYDFPTWVMIVAFSIGSVVASLAGMFAVRPIFHKLIHGQDSSNEMVSLAIASVSVFYAILLGLVAAGVYGEFSSTTDIVEREASTLSALYSDTAALPEPHRAKLLAELRDYAQETIKNDWPIQAKGKVPTGGTDRIIAFQRDLAAVKPSLRIEEIAYAEAAAQFEKLVELRSNRLARVIAGMPNLLWSMLLFGAILTVTIIWMLDMDIWVHSIMTAVLSLFLGLVIFLIADMDKPFRGDVLVTSDAYELVHNSLMSAR
jgi:hypothetical protein